VRLPSTLATIADSLVKDKGDLLTTYGDAAADIEQATKDVRQLREDILRNGPLLPFEGQGEYLRSYIQGIRGLLLINICNFIV